MRVLEYQCSFRRYRVMGAERVTDVDSRDYSGSASEYVMMDILNLRVGVVYYEASSILPCRNLDREYFLFRVTQSLQFLVWSLSF